MQLNWITFLGICIMFLFIHLFFTMRGELTLTPDLTTLLIIWTECRRQEKILRQFCFFIFTLDGSVAKGVCSRESHFPRSGRHIVSIMFHTVFGGTEPFKKHCGNKHKEIERETKEGKMLSELQLSHLFGSTKNSDGECLYSLPVFVNGIF